MSFTHYDIASMLNTPLTNNIIEIITEYFHLYNAKRIPILKQDLYDAVKERHLAIRSMPAKLR